MHIKVYKWHLKVFHEINGIGSQLLVIMCDPCIAIGIIVALKLQCFGNKVSCQMISNRTSNLYLVVILYLVTSNRQ